MCRVYVLFFGSLFRVLPAGFHPQHSHSSSAHSTPSLWGHCFFACTSIFLLLQPLAHIGAVLLPDWALFTDVIEASPFDIRQKFRHFLVGHAPDPVRVCGRHVHDFVVEPVATAKL